MRRCKALLSLCRIYTVQDPAPMARLAVRLRYRSAQDDTQRGAPARASNPLVGRGFTPAEKNTAPSSRFLHTMAPPLPPSRKGAEYADLCYSCFNKSKANLLFGWCKWGRGLRAPFREGGIRGEPAAEGVTKMPSPYPKSHATRGSLV